MRGESGSGCEVDSEGEQSGLVAMRRKNIESNRAMMRLLRLSTLDFELHHSHRDQEDGRGEANAEFAAARSSGPQSKAIRLKRKGSGALGTGVTRGPMRRSTRLACLFASEGASQTSVERERALPPSKEIEFADGGTHEAAAEAYERRHAGRQGRGAFVGTASYAHTLMRVRTLSEQALSNRIKAIERSKGKYAVVKMRLFAQVLALDGFDCLTRDATDALVRLISVLGDVPQE